MQWYFSALILKSVEIFSKPCLGGNWGSLSSVLGAQSRPSQQEQTKGLQIGEKERDETMFGFK